MIIFYLENKELNDVFDLNISEKVRNSVGWKVHTKEELRTLINNILKEDNNND